jgi:ring-1,2-phenylacetyl-CoA epoxidase subunit PaaD
MDTMRDDLEYALRSAGYREIEVRTVLQPAWSTDWISEDGKRKLAEAGIAPPGAAPKPVTGPIPLTLSAPVRQVRCPLCDSEDTEELSRFSATACKALRRCRTCLEPFEHVKEI